MKRIAAVLLFLSSLIPACGQKTTPNLGLTLPSYGSANWNVPFNADLSTLDTAIGRLQVPFKGSWSSTAVYSRGDQVSYLGFEYVSLINSNFDNSPANTAAWELIPVPTPISIGFGTGSGSPNSDASPRVSAPHGGTITKCAVTVTASDGSVPFQFQILKNGADVFSTDPTVSAGTASCATSSCVIYLGLSSASLVVNQGDVFQFNILQGSPNWKVTLQLE